MHQAGHRAFREIADRIADFGRVRVEFAHVRHKLPRDRIVWVSPVDQRNKGRCDGDRVSRANLRNAGIRRARNEPGIGEILHSPQCALTRAHFGGHVSVS